MKYDILKPWKSLDPWQEKILATPGNICVRSGRQVGKSTVVSIKAGEFAMKHKNKVIMVVASVERSAYLLFEKVLSYIFARNKKCISGRPTKKEIKLKNGSRILCLPTGDSGYGIRGHTIDLLIADEAAFINDDVWTAVAPMLTVTGGDTWLLSTPLGREGYFHDSFEDPTYTSFHISTEAVRDLRSGIIKVNIQKVIDSAKRRFSKAKYTQEILGEFSDVLTRVFTTNWIKSVCTLPQSHSVVGDLFLGVDIAGMGEDESSFEVLGGTKERLRQVHHETTQKTRTTDTEDKIIYLEKKYKFNKIGLDDGGMGVGVFDHLLLNDLVKRKIIALNNARRFIDDEGKEKGLLKDDMYMNLLVMGERGELQLFDNEEIKRSLKSIQCEKIGGKSKIMGEYSHITEGLIRAAWCAKQKGLKIWVA